MSPKGSDHCAMDSAGSGLEPNYEAEVRQDVSGAGRVPDSTSDTAADEIRLDRQDGTSARGTGRSVEQTSDEQTAADVLARADGLEPEYDFESAEGGVHSPERDGLQQDRLMEPSEIREQYRGVREAQSHLGSVRPEGFSGLGQREAEVRLPVRGRDTTLLNGGPRPGKGRGNPSVFSGWEEAGFTVQASQETQGVSRVRPGGGPLGVEATRMEHLEFLVEQLLEQNAQLKQERLDAQRRSSADCDVGWAGSVHSEGRVQDEGRSLTERRNARSSGEFRLKTGKGIGSSGDDGWAPTLRTLQPPWTSFAQSEDVCAPSLPAVGPGDRFLAATRAMQQLNITDPRDLEGPDIEMRDSVREPWPVPTGTSCAGMPQFSSSAAKPDLDRAEFESQKVEPREMASVEVPASVTVMVNGVPRKGIFNAKGEVVLQSEQPKYFAIEDGDQGAKETGNPFAASAPTPFRSLSPVERQKPQAPPPPPPPPQVSPTGACCGQYFRGARVGSRSPSGARSGYPRRPSRSPNPSPPRMPMQVAGYANASPATPGGTKVPKLPPPASPPREPQRDTAVRAADLEGRQLLEEGDSVCICPAQDGTLSPAAPDRSRDFCFLEKAVGPEPRDWGLLLS